tara:strand:+ start:64 stop:390 length:327 start_codon:yes stop_codon:yes gene_type:complete
MEIFILDAVVPRSPEDRSRLSIKHVTQGADSARPRIAMRVRIIALLLRPTRVPRSVDFRCRRYFARAEPKRGYLTLKRDGTSTVDPIRPDDQVIEKDELVWETRTVIC